MFNSGIRDETDIGLIFYVGMEIQKLITQKKTSDDLHIIVLTADHFGLALTKVVPIVAPKASITIKHMVDVDDTITYILQSN